jgi:hypothetical protein
LRKKPKQFRKVSPKGILQTNGLGKNPNVARKDPNSSVKSPNAAGKDLNTFGDLLRAFFLRRIDF